MRRAALAALLLGLLAGCGSSPDAVPTFDLAGGVANWNGSTATVTAPLWPSGEAVAQSSVATDGRFSISVPGALSPTQLRGGFEQTVVGYACTTVTQDPAAAEFVAIYHLGIQGTTDILVQASSFDIVAGTPSVGDWAYHWFYADRPATVTAECSAEMNGRTSRYSYDLDLAEGWNPVRLTVTSTTATETTFDARVLAAPDDAGWYRWP